MNKNEFDGYAYLRYAVIEDGIQAYKSLLKKRWRYLNAGKMTSYRSRHLNDEIEELEDFFDSGVVENWTEGLTGKFIKNNCYKEAYKEYKAWLKNQNKKQAKQYLKRLKRKALAA